MSAFLGVPIHIGDELVAMVGLANQPGGYTEADVGLLQPMLGTVRNWCKPGVTSWSAERTGEELKATTDLLREKSGVLRDTLESIDQGLAKMDASGRLVAYNQRFLELLDLPEPLMASKPSQEAILRFQRDRGDFGPEQSFVDPADRGFIENLDPQRAPDLYLRRTQDGRTLEFHSRTTRDGGMVRTCSDVSPYIEAQDALRSERQRLEWVLEATRPGIWETDQLTGHMTINARWADMLGYTVEELAPVRYTPGQACCIPMTLASQWSATGPTAPRKFRTSNATCACATRAGTGSGSTPGAGCTAETAAARPCSCREPTWTSRTA